MSKLSENYESVISEIGYEFENPALLFQAFTRRSYSQENGGENNEVLEFVGDRVLDFYVTKILMDYYGVLAEDYDDYDPNEDDNEFSVERFDTEGKLTNIKQKLVNKKMLAHRIEKLGFNEFLFMGKGDVNQQKQYEDSVMEDLFEAILGAIAIDSKWNAQHLEEAVKLMLNIDYYLENGFGNDEDDYVSLIQEWNQKEHGELPIYEFEESYYGYRASLNLKTSRGAKYFSKDGYSKSDARAKVAEAAYNYLVEYDLLWSIMDELPEDLSMENSINVLQELAQKGYISMPQYDQDDYQTNQWQDNIPRWGCSVYISSNNLRQKGFSTTKKDAKKYAAYLCICEICGLKNIYQK